MVSTRGVPGRFPDTAPAPELHMYERSTLLIILVPAVGSPLLRSGPHYKKEMLK